MEQNTSFELILILLLIISCIFFTEIHSSAIDYENKKIFLEPEIFINTFQHIPVAIPIFKENYKCAEGRTIMMKDINHIKYMVLLPYFRLKFHDNQHIEIAFYHDKQLITFCEYKIKDNSDGISLKKLNGDLNSNTFRKLFLKYAMIPFAGALKARRMIYSKDGKDYPQITNIENIIAYTLLFYVNSNLKTNSNIIVRTKLMDNYLKRFCNENVYNYFTEPSNSKRFRVYSSDIEQLSSVYTWNNKNAGAKRRLTLISICNYNKVKWVKTETIKRSLKWDYQN